MMRRWDGVSGSLGFRQWMAAESLWSPAASPALLRDVLGVSRGMRYGNVCINNTWYLTLATLVVHL